MTHLALLISFFSTIHFPPCALSCKGLRTQLQTLPGLCAHTCKAYSHIQADSDLQTQIHYCLHKSIHFKSTKQKLHLPLRPRSIYKFPWSADHGQADLLPIILYYFWVDNPLNQPITFHTPRILEIYNIIITFLYEKNN